MKQKKTSIKIKKSKHNLYNKKKSKSRQTLTIVLTVVAACVLGVVGYGIGKPIMNYFQTRGEHTDSSDPGGTSSDISSEISSDNSFEDSSGDSSGSDTPPVPPEVEDIKLYVLPVDATASSASLGSALAAAKEAGYDTVAVTLKDENGYLYYKTEVERVRYDSIIVKGTLTAAQIAEQITNAGMTPAAKISMLKDRITPMYFGGFTFENGTHWLDDYPPPDGSGKRWLSPFVPESVQYLTNIASELAGAGFEHIICENITYPAFHPIDIDTYLKHLSLTDRTKRLNALWDMADAAKGAVEAHGAKLWLELNGADFIKADRFGTNAEIAGDSEKLGSVGVIVSYSQSGTESVYDNAKAFAGSLRTAAGENNDIAVLVKRGTSGAVSEDIRRAFEENGLRLFTEN
ncbi:MAG: hypothetical protein K2N56_09300 [Oscillospiraceae bacterium]|nr:hypothetical protein [Oscillospiraceae bacterium]